MATTANHDYLLKKEQEEDTNLEKKLVSLKKKCPTCQKEYSSDNQYYCVPHSRMICGLCCMKGHQKCVTNNYGDQLTNALTILQRSSFALSQDNENLVKYWNSIIGNYRKTVDKLNEHIQRAEATKNVCFTNLKSISECQNALVASIDNEDGVEPVATRMEQLTDKYEKLKAELLEVNDRAKSFGQLYEKVESLMQCYETTKALPQRSDIAPPGVPLRSKRVSQASGTPKY